MSKRRVSAAAAGGMLCAVLFGAAGCAEDRPAEVIQPTAEESDGSEGGSVEPTGDPEAVEEDPEEIEEPKGSGTAQLGDTVSVGTWDVRVTDVNLNASTEIEKANEFNDRAKGTYVLISFDATYSGSERTADAFWDLTWTFTTSDDQVRNTADAVTPSDSKESPTTARNGGTVSTQVVFDLPPKLVKGGLLTVEGYDDNYDTVYAEFLIE